MAARRGKTYEEHVNKSYWANEKAVTYRYVYERYTPQTAGKVLDYGAGPHLLHTNILRGKGFHVDAIDVGNNFVPGLHDPGVYKRKYHVIYASNVINVQPTIADIYTMLDQIVRMMNKGSTFICNYPTTPRDADLSVPEITTILKSVFGMVIRVEKYIDTSVPIFSCSL
jgi:hypothetical protein